MKSKNKLIKNLSKSSTTRRSFLRSTLAIGAGGTALSLFPGLAARAENVSGTIRYSNWIGGPGDIEMWGNVIAAFEAANPGTKIEYEPVAWTEYWTKLNTQFASRSAPDIIGFQMQSRTWGVEGRFEPLSEPFADLLDGIVSSQLKVTQAPIAGGMEQYGLPFRMVGASLFGNISAMKAAGIDYPSEDWTIDDFVAAAKRLTNADQWGTAVTGGPVDLNQASTFGARPTTLDYSTATFNSPEYTEFIKWQHDLIYKHKVAPAPADLSTQKEPFSSGAVAMFPSASWMYPGYREIESFEWDILPDPIGSHEPKTYAGPDNLGITTDSKNKALAIAFLRFVFTRASQTVIASTGMPVVIDYLLDESRIAKEAASGPANYGYFVKGAVERGEGYAFAPPFFEILGHINDAYALIMNEESPDIDGILANANARIQQALDA